MRGGDLPPFLVQGPGRGGGAVQEAGQPGLQGGRAGSRQRTPSRKLPSMARDSIRSSRSACLRARRQWYRPNRTPPTAGRRTRSRSEAVMAPPPRHQPTPYIVRMGGVGELGPQAGFTATDRAFSSTKFPAVPDLLQQARLDRVCPRCSASRRSSRCPFGTAPAGRHSGCRPSSGSRR